MKDKLAFQFKHANRTYPNGTQALDGFSFKADKGERVSILGPSGCGKSTILRLISKLDITDNPDSLVIFEDDSKPVGFVFQEANLMPWANVFDNVYMPLRLAGVPRETAREDVEQMLKRMYLEKCADLWPYELSGGMKMRVSIARALISRPKILLLDEPFAALDEITRFKLNDLLLELHKKDQFTMVLVTHSTFESAYLSQRVAVMSNNPNKVAEEIILPPNNEKNYRESKAYGENCARLSASLHKAMNNH